MQCTSLTDNTNKFFLSQGKENDNKEGDQNETETTNPTAEEIRQARINFFDQAERVKDHKDVVFGQEEVDSFFQSDLAKDDGDGDDGGSAFQSR